MKIKEQEIKGDFEGFTPFQIECDKGYVIGTHQHKENRICVSHAMCQGCFKELMNYIVSKFKTNNVLLYSVINLSNWNKLRGFSKVIMFDKHFKEDVICLEGKWENTQNETKNR